MEHEGKCMMFENNLKTDGYGVSLLVSKLKAPISEATTVVHPPTLYGRRVVGVDPGRIDLV